jgi:hypothetical protein
MTTPNLPPRSIAGSSPSPIEESDPAGCGSAVDIEGDEPGLDNEDYEPGWGDRFRTPAGRALVRLGWLVLAAGFAFGTAGLAAAAEHSPSSGSRPELTWGADRELSVKLDAAVRDLARLNDDVVSLGDMARATLSSLAQVNQVGLQSAWEGGANDVNSIDVGAADLNERLDCAAWDTTLSTDLIKTYSPALVDRYHKVCLAVASVAPLQSNWQAMVDGSKTAIRVANDIEDHDSVAADALQLATQGRYPEALAKLSGATADIADANAIASDLAKTSDVSTLTQWLSRTKQMDDALGLLWQSMIDSKGKVTAQVTAALRAVNSAKALLPDDNSVLQVVLYEMAGNLTANGITIETAKGALADALTDLGGGTVSGG